MTTILDFHTHDMNATSALISVSPRQFNPQPGKWYSVGYHPWHDVDHLTDDDFTLLEQCAAHPQVLAIGETGMDSLRGAPIDIQAMVYVRHLELAARLNKPVVAHNVRTTQEILTQRHRAGLDHVTLAIHGMRGNAHVARTLIDAGCYLSYGLQFNPSALQATPLDRLLIETDDAPISIHEVTARIGENLHLTVNKLMSLTSRNTARFLGLDT